MFVQLQNKKNAPDRWIFIEEFVRKGKLAFVVEEVKLVRGENKTISIKAIPAETFSAWYTQLGKSGWKLVLTRMDN